MAQPAQPIAPIASMISMESDHGMFVARGASEAPQVRWEFSAVQRCSLAADPLAIPATWGHKHQSLPHRHY